MIGPVVLLLLFFVFVFHCNVGWVNLLHSMESDHSSCWNRSLLLLILFLELSFWWHDLHNSNTQCSTHLHSYHTQQKHSTNIPTGKMILTKRELVCVLKILYLLVLLLFATIWNCVAFALACSAAYQVRWSKFPFTLLTTTKNWIMKNRQTD